MPVLVFDANEKFEPIVVKVGGKEFTASSKLPLALLMINDETTKPQQHLAKIFGVDASEFDDLDARVAMRIIKGVMKAVQEATEGKGVNPTAAASTGGAPNAGSGK